MFLFVVGVYMVDFVNVEYVFKMNFVNYLKGDSNCMVMWEFFGFGIFFMDGLFWKE